MARTHGLAIGALACAIAVGLARPMPVAAEYCRPVMPDRAADVRGSTFAATVVGIRTEGRSPTSTFVTLAVEQVYANRDSDRLRAGEAIELPSNACDGFALVGLRAGDRIVMSTAFLEAAAGPSTWNTAVWRVDGGRLRLAVLGEAFDRVWFTDDRRIAAAGTLGEVLALVAPGRLAAPDTATAAQRGAAEAPWAVMLAALLAALTDLGLAVVGLRQWRSTVRELPVR